MNVNHSVRRYFLHSNFIEYKPSPEVDSRSSGQEIPRLLWNLKVHWCVQKCPPMDPILEPDRSSLTLLSLIFTLIISSHLLLDLAISLFLPGFSTKILHAVLSTYIRDSCRAHYVLLDLISLIIFREL